MVFNAIPKGVFFRLVLLTMFDNSNKDKRVDKLYLIHAKALLKARLIKGNFLILSNYVKVNEYFFLFLHA